MYVYMHVYVCEECLCVCVCEYLLCEIFQIAITFRPYVLGSLSTLKKYASTYLNMMSSEKRSQKSNGNTIESGSARNRA